jgi:2-methylisocitrate lyase-like PEP mutase family enzyme
MAPSGSGGLAPVEAMGRRYGRAMDKESTRAEKARHFLDLHEPGSPLLLPNPWDAGTAKLLASLGYRALATTSSGHAGTLGRLDGAVSREEALGHAGDLAGATKLPVSADLENGFADSPAEVAETVRAAAGVGLAGCSIEDFTGRPDDPIYDAKLAEERIAAAAAVSRDEATRIVLTARAESHLHGGNDLAETIARLQSFVAAGADVVYAPGLRELADIERVTRAVEAPVNVLLLPGGPTVAQLASVGVARISVGGAFHLVSLAAVAAAGRELLEQGTHDFWTQALAALPDRTRAFSGDGLES